MSTPATASVPRRRRPVHARRPGPIARGVLVEVWLRLHTTLIYAFLYLPIVVVVVFSFNGTNRRVTEWDGLSLRWYEYVLNDAEVQSYLVEQRDRRASRTRSSRPWSARWRRSGCSGCRAGSGSRSTP